RGRLERVEAAVAFAEEEEPSGRGEPAADQRLLGVVLPRELAGVDVHRRDAAPLLLARDDLERAAEPELGAAGVLGRLDVVGHRLVQVERAREPILLVGRPRGPLHAGPWRP